MDLKRVKNKFKILSYATNIFVLILVPFIIWMLFFDENSYIAHTRYNKEINDLQRTINFYKTEIKNDRNIIQGLKDSLKLEKFAREKYLMKRKNEDIYIIEFDTIKK